MRTIGRIVVSLLAWAHVAGIAAAQSSVRLNEVLANAASVQDGGVVTDWVELYNTGATAADLGGAALSDNLATPRRFVFATGTLIPAGGYLVVHFNPLLAVSATNTGFGIGANGGTLYFSDKPENGGAEIDRIQYGIQAADFSIGRSPNGTGAWVLTQPTPRAANVVAQLDPPNGLVVNEWFATGSDFIELYNPGARPVALGGLVLTDDTRFLTRDVIPALSFIGVGALGAYSVFYANDVGVGTDGSGANYRRFKLSGAGETIYIFSDGVPIHSTTFGPQGNGPGSEGRLPDGGDTIVKFELSPTPGKPNGNLAELADIRINELLAHTDPPLEDAIEFRNMTDLPINMKGWKLEAREARDGQIQERTRTEYVFSTDYIVPANGYAVLYEYQFLGANEMRFNSAHGGEVKLYQADGNGFYSAFTTRSFGPSENGVSFGWVETSEGKDWVPLNQRTFAPDPRATTLANFRKGKGWPNAPAKVSPIVINEIHYHPPDIGTNDNTLDEFIELRNTTTRSFPLFDPARYYADKNYSADMLKGTLYADGRTNTWRIRGDVDFDFPTGVEVPAGGTVLVVNFDPVTNLTQLGLFRALFPNLPPNVLLFGPYKNSLKNGGGDVELKRPDMPQGPNHPDDFRHVPYLSADRVRYKDVAPWPPQADGTGASLQRRKVDQYASEPLNWKAGVPTPGQRNAEPPVLLTTPGNLAYIAGNDVSFAVTASGTPPLRHQWSFKGTNLPAATNATLLLENLQPNQVGIYSVVVSNDEGSVGASAELRLDSVKPVLTVTSPKAGIRWSNDVITVSGTVRDDFGVSEVLVRLNGGEFQPAAGTTNWSLDLALTAGTNVIQVTAVDLGANRAPTNTVRVIRVVASLLTLTVSGNGTVSPNLNGQLLEVGRNYVLTATPLAGNLFSNWTGGIVSSASPLSFKMQSNLVLQANFVANPFIPARGIYNGLFFDETAPAHVNAGFVTLNVTDLGAYSGSLMQGTKKYSFSGRLNLDGRATNTVALGKTNLVTLELAMNLAETLKRFNGRILANGWQASLLAEQTGFAAPAAAPFAGAYTFNFLGSDQAGEPTGDGYATSTVAATGAATLAGMLADGTKAAQKVAVTRGDLWPVYVSLYSGKGSLFGWLAFSNTPPHNTVYGNLQWTKPVLPSSKLYPAGFAFPVGAHGSRYTAPAAGERVLPLTDTVLVFSGGDLAEPVQCQITLGTDNKVVNNSTNKLTVTITPATGLFGGSLAHPVTGKAIAFKGTLLENVSAGGGYFLGTNASGRVQFGP